jgi:hypothetical protein
LIKNILVGLIGIVFGCCKGLVGVSGYFIVARVC